MEEEVDWNGRLSDDEEFDDTPHTSSNFSPFAPSFGSPFRETVEKGLAGEGLGLIARQLQDNQRSSAADQIRTASVDVPPPSADIKGAHTLEAIPDASPPDSNSITRSPLSVSPQSHLIHPQPISPTSSIRSHPKTSTSPTNGIGLLDLGHGYHQHGTAYRSSSRTSSRGSSSPYRIGFGHDRARSPLGRSSDDEEALDSHGALHSVSPPRVTPHHPSPHFDPHTHGHAAHHTSNGSPIRLSLARQSSSGSNFGSIRNGPITPGSSSTSANGLISPLDIAQQGVPIHRNEEEEEEEGLAIDFGSKRGRKGSVLGRRTISEE